MPGGLDATTCGVCGAHLARETDACPRCSAPLTGLRTTSDTLLAGTAPASGGSRVVAFVVDAFVIVAASVAAWVVTAAAGATALGPVLGLTAALVAGTLLLRSFRASGRTPGAVVGGLRYVDAFAGTAPGPGRWPGQQLDAVDLKVRDPLAPAGPPAPAVPAPTLPQPTTTAPRAPLPLAPALPEPQPAAPASRPPRRPEPPPAAPRTPQPPSPQPPPRAPRPPAVAPERPLAPPRPRPDAPARPPQQPQRQAPAPRPEPPPARPAGGAVLISGPARIHVAGTALVGRDPRPNPDEHVDVLVPFGDFDLSISTTHAHLQWDGSICWVTDRGSTNGTSVTTSEGTWRVPPGASAPARPGDTVHLGSRPFTVVVAG